MVIGVEDGKARRLAGMKRANAELTAAQRVHRALINGRPPASEFRTPLAAVAAARVLHRDIESRMVAEGLKPQQGNWGVAVGYITPDLTTVGATVLYGPREEANMLAHLTGSIMLGTVFGIVDEAQENSVVSGVKPFFTTKQTEGWLAELLYHVPDSISHEHRSRKFR